MSFYSTYRPQTIESLDLVAARTLLSSILKTGSFSHAYLFTGPKGTGKTSSARILAKVLNCQENQSSNNHLSEPCNVCDSCRRITAGTSMTCLEMDAASNRGIDDIRMLRERIGLAPVEGMYTVYIIDEVHMLTTEAFNALLKTLEEPPRHAVFILCTTDPQKIPDTVVSRCTKVAFQRASTEEIVASLQKAIQGEQLTIEPVAVQRIAQSAEGSFRDALKLLEQVVQLGSPITQQSVDVVTGYGSQYSVNDLCDALLRRDAVHAIQLLHDKEHAGVDILLLARRLTEMFRDRLIAVVESGKPADSLLIALTEAVSLATVQIKQSMIPILPLELLIARHCVPAFESHEKSCTSSQVHVLTSVADVPKIIPKQPRSELSHQSTQQQVSLPQSPGVDNPTVSSAVFVGSLEVIIEKWQSILAAVRPINHSLEALLRSARPTAYEDGWLTIEAYYKFHKEQLEQDRYKRQLEHVVCTILGGNVYLRFALGDVALVKPNLSGNTASTSQDVALAAAADEIFGK